MDAAEYLAQLKGNAAPQVQQPPAAAPAAPAMTPELQALMNGQAPPPVYNPPAAPQPTRAQAPDGTWHEQQPDGTWRPVAASHLPFAPPPALPVPSPVVQQQLAQPQPAVPAPPVPIEAPKKTRRRKGATAVEAIEGVTLEAENNDTLARATIIAACIAKGAGVEETNGWLGLL